MAIDKEKKRIVSVVLDVEVHEEVKALAKANNRSASAQMALAIQEMIEKNRKGLI